MRLTLRNIRTSNFLRLTLFAADWSLACPAYEDYQQDSVPVELGLKYLAIRALSPVDLAVSKISRLADPDKEDIHDLVCAGLTSAAEIESRAEKALNYFIGNTSSLRFNIRDALEIARSAERERVVASKHP